MTAKAYTVPTWPVRVRTCSLDSMSHTWGDGAGRSETQMVGTGAQSQALPLGVHPYMDEVLVGATNNVVICHGDRVYTATRRLQDMDAVEGPDVPDL